MTARNGPRPTRPDTKKRTAPQIPQIQPKIATREPNEKLKKLKKLKKLNNVGSIFV